MSYWSELTALAGDGTLIEIQLADGGWYPIKEGTFAFLYDDEDSDTWAEFEVRGDPAGRRRLVKAKMVLGYAFEHDIS